MENKEYLIYGAGGHARVLKSLINQMDRTSRVLNFFSDAESPKLLDELPVLPYDKSIHPESLITLGIGSGKVRKSLVDKVEHSFATLVHPTASVADDAEIGEGTVILPFAVIQSGAKVGRHVIVNSNVSIDHDAVVGDYVTTYPGVYIGGEASVGEGTLLNANAVIMRFSVVPAFMEVMPGEVFHPGFL